MNNKPSQGSKQSIPLANRLSFRILFTLVILSIMVTAITSGSLLLLSSEHLTINIQDRNMAIALQSSRQIEWYFNEVITDFIIMADYLSLIPETKINYQAIFLKNQGLYRNFPAIAVFDAQWQSLYSSTLDKKIDLNPGNLDVISDSFYLSEVKISEKGFPYVTFGKKIESENKPIYVIAEANLSELWNIMDSIQIENEIMPYLFSDTGQLLFHPDKKFVLAKMLPPGLPSPPKTVFSPIKMQLNRGKGLSYSFLQIYVPVNINGHSWFLSLQQTLKDAYLPVQSFMIQGSVILLFIGLMTFVSGYYLTQLFAAPLNTLMKATFVVAKGNWSRRIPIRRNDEIGQLTLAFNTMLERLKQRDQALRESEASYRLVTENVNDVIFVLNKSAEFLFLNQQTNRITGFNPYELFGKKISEIISKDKADEMIEFIESKITLDDLPYFETDVLFNTPLGKKTFEIRIVKNEVPDSDFYIYGVARDVTEKKKAEEELLKYQETLRNMASEIVYAEEREKRKFAIFLHDNIGQTLAMCRLKGKLLQREIKESGITLLKQLDELLTQSIKEARSLTFDMSSPLLYEIGLKAEIERLIEDLESKHNILVQFHHRILSDNLKQEIKILLSRAVKELLHNAIKHADASQIQIALIQDNDIIELKISDNGKGFHYEKASLMPSKKGGFGLFNISEGIKHLGGQLRINSQANQGTEINISIPLIN
ncbi:MAG: PAS domain S-box protein [Spirochaetales bacterium]|nr:PAS domain S-box protein [Spirochaetales bacterium]